MLYTLPGAAGSKSAIEHPSGLVRVIQAGRVGMVGMGVRKTGCWEDCHDAGRTQEANQMVVSLNYCSQNGEIYIGPRIIMGTQI